MAETQTARIKTIKFEFENGGAAMSNYQSTRCWFFFFLLSSRHSSVLLIDVWSIKSHPAHSEAPRRPLLFSCRAFCPPWLLFLGCRNNCFCLALLRFSLFKPHSQSHLKSPQHTQLWKHQRVKKRDISSGATSLCQHFLFPFFFPLRYKNSGDAITNAAVAAKKFLPPCTLKKCAAPFMLCERCKPRNNCVRCLEMSGEWGNWLMDER